MVAPIVGATNKHHLDDAICALAIALSAAEKAALETPYVPRLRTDYS